VRTIIVMLSLLAAGCDGPGGATGVAGPSNPLAGNVKFHVLTTTGDHVVHARTYQVQGDCALFRDMHGVRVAELCGLVSVEILP